MRESVAQWATVQPNAPAIQAPGRTDCSWAELRAQLDDTAEALGAAGIGPGQVVAIALPSTAETATAIVSIAAHTACAPLNSNASGPELMATIQRVGPAAVIVPRGPTPAAAAAEACGVPVMRLLSEEAAGRFRLTRPKLEAGAKVVDHVPRTPAGVDHDTALVIVTSGTTGVAKVITRSERQALASVRHTAATMDLGPADRSLVVLPLAFGYGRDTALLAALESGGAAICANQFDGRHLLQWIEEFGATWIAATPPIHHALASIARTEPARAAACGLRLLRSGSAAIPPEVIDTVEQSFGAPLLVAYASTEAGIMASERLHVRKRGTVGTAVETDIAVVDDNGEHVEPGNPGEILVRNDWMMSPDADRADLFVDGWLRTGDLGTLDGDGFLTIHGRLSEVINRGGEKISPSEVEAVLRSHPTVGDVAVFPVPHRSLGEDVAAAVVVAPGATLEPTELRRHAASQLTPSKLPHRVVIVDEIPLSAAGKVQRANLAALLGVAEHVVDEAARPHTPFEKSLAEIWATVLGIDEIGTDTDFVELGGDSLAATAVTSAIYDECGADLPAEWLLEPGATIARLATMVNDDRSYGRPILLRAGAGSAAPFFCLPGIRGNALMLHQLATAMHSDRSFYGLRSPKSVKGEELPDDMRGLAAHHAAQVKELQPSGPYAIGGYSYGGFVAYEMARLLEEDGAEVQCLVLIDTWAPGFPPQPPLLVRRLRRHLIPSERRAAQARSREQGMKERVEIEPEINALKRTRRRAFGKWRPEPTTVPIAVISSAAKRSSVDDGTLGWRKFARGSIDQYPVSGPHRGLVSHPHVSEVASVLDSILDNGATR